MKKISLKGLAKYMTGTHTAQRKVLKDFKYPDPEGSAQVIYYREARQWIQECHQVGGPDQLMQRALSYMMLSKKASGATKTRYSNNARAARAYARNFAFRQFEILPECRMRLQIEDVIVTVVPDLHVIEGGKEKIIKLDFSDKSQDERLYKILTQAMFEAQEQAGMGLKAGQVLCFDVERGVEKKIARAGTRMAAEIEAACKNISAIWDGI